MQQVFLASFQSFFDGMPVHIGHLHNFPSYLPKARTASRKSPCHNNRTDLEVQQYRWRQKRKPHEASRKLRLGIVHRTLLAIFHTLGNHSRVPARNVRIQKDYAALPTASDRGRGTRWWHVDLNRATRNEIWSGQLHFVCMCVCWFSSNSVAQWSD